jgi:hypothetical protein
MVIDGVCVLCPTVTFTLTDDGATVMLMEGVTVMLMLTTAGRQGDPPTQLKVSVPE